jgi:hypothetical protein
MKVVAFLTAYAVVDRIIDHLQLTFFAEKPPRLKQSSRNVFRPPILPPGIFSDRSQAHGAGGRRRK